jgi:uncharacterized protein DUF5678
VRPDHDPSRVADPVKWVCSICGTSGTKSMWDEASAEATKHENAGCVAHELEPVPADHVWRRMYEGEWIAVFDHVVVAHAEECVDVYRELNRQGVRHGPVLQYMTRRKPQSQASLYDQLRELHVLANRAGLYDAADWLQGYVETMRGADDVVAQVREAGETP